MKVGYPDAWTDYSPGRHSPRRVLGRRGRGPALRRRGRPQARRATDRAARTWLLPPSSPDAYIDVQLNLMALPAGFLQAPAFDLAAIGCGELRRYRHRGGARPHAHAIDALGADFDAAGQPRKWWADPDLAAFQKLGQCSVDQYDGLRDRARRASPGQAGPGEALGDLAGVRLAYRASSDRCSATRCRSIDGLSPEQQFFIAWGQLRGAAESPELQRQMVKADPHPTARYRIIGPLSNAPEFQQAFSPARPDRPW